MQYIEFNPNLDTTINNKTKMLNYQSDISGEIKKGIAWGQQKLLLQTVQFLTNYYDGRKAKFVYAGAAPGINMILIAEMFPLLDFYLYDPRPFCVGLQNKKRFKLFNKLFTDEDAEYWSKEPGDIYFLSDIRVHGGVGFEGTSDELEQFIVQELNMQQSWHIIINPVVTSLKFRLPYPKNHVEENFEYLYGIPYLQPWAGKGTSESRLIIKREFNNKKVFWNILEYQNKFQYINIVIRGETLFENILFNNREVYLKDILMNDFDSTLHVFILMKYFESRGVKDKIEMIELINKFTLSSVEIIKRFKPNTLSFDIRRKMKHKDLKAIADNDMDE